MTASISCAPDCHFAFESEVLDDVEVSLRAAIAWVQAAALGVALRRAHLSLGRHNRLR
jgi:hypothetical protein